MSVNDAAADGEEVSDFLRRIKELGDKRDQEDMERTRKLEEEIKEGRRQREARRERVRSQSPEKQSPAVTPQSSRAPNLPPINDDRPVLSAAASSVSSAQVTSESVSKTPSRETPETQPSSGARVERRTESVRPLSQAGTPSPHGLGSPFKPSSPSAALPSRSATISRQQRPGAVRAADSRPTSMVSNSPSQSVVPGSSALGAQDSGKEPSRNDIAKSLESKGPAWFRQTADRGLPPAAYKRSQEQTSPAQAVTPERRQLHGLGRTASMEPEDLRRSIHENRLASPPPSSSPAFPQKESQKLEPPQDERSTDAGADESATPRPAFGSGRRSPEGLDRPSSPTKGMGGFVQSAMLRRNESVNKRWSAQPSSDLPSRQDGRSDRSPIRSESPEKLPSSNSAPKLGEVPSLKSPKKASMSSTISAGPAGESLEEDTRPSSREGRAASVIEVQPATPQSPSRASSPSKRWSANKSSWIESALKQPDVKEIKPAASKQPSWMQDLHKRKMSKDTTAPRLAAAVEQEEDAGKNPDDAHSESTERLQQEANVKAIAATDSAESARIARQKPETPPKKDFRSQLKSSSASSSRDGKNSTDGLEFRNALGSLKRATTEKYEAPDMLKSNILRGKAGLNITGGPQKSERKDEFKESLVEQKTAMKAKAAEAKPIDKMPRKEDSALPEALVRRKTLGRQDRPTSTSGSAAKVSESRDLNVAGPKDEPPPISHATKPNGSGGSIRQATKPAGNKLADRFNPGLAGVLARGPRSPLEGSGPPEENAQEAIKSPLIPTSRESEVEPASSKSLDHMTKSRAKGPKRRTPRVAGAMAAEGKIARAEGDADEATTSTTKALSTQLGETTPTAPRSEASIFKAVAAKAEERQAASKTAPLLGRPITSKTLESAEAKETESLSRSAKGFISSPKAKPTAPSSSRNIPPSKAAAPLVNKPSPPASSRRVSTQKPPMAATNSVKELESETIAPTLTAVDSSKSAPLQPHNASKAPPSKQTPASANGKKAMATSTGKENQEDDRNQLAHEKRIEETQVGRSSVKAVTARWAQANSPATPSTRKEPIKLPTRKDEEIGSDPQIIETAASPDKLRKSVDFKAPVPANPAKSSSSPELRNEGGPVKDLSPRISTSFGQQDGGSSLDDSRRSMSGASFKSFKSEGKSPVPQTTEAQKLFTDFFGEIPQAPSQLHIDTASVLSNPGQSSNGKIKTLRKTIVGITGDGRTMPVDTHQDNMLFSESMYLCTHIFGDSKGARLTEVYLWLGSNVADSTVEDVQIFAKRSAKDANGTLVTFRQGKETSNFLQALGGIVISRFGTAAASINRPFMLCGRRHLGHIAFDEVPFQLASFTSAFAFIICSEPGRLLIWKGRGAHSDEITCAKIIAMDLAPAANVTDVDEGSEPSSFLDMFPDPISATTGKSIPKVLPRSAEHWKLKPAYDKYHPRLFKVESVSDAMTGLGLGGIWSSITRRPSTPTSPSPKIQIREIEPFTQADLESEGIYILDAFFEIYVLPGPLAHKRGQHFAASLLFAQDYSIMAASSEDRPYVPVSTVVMAGVPRDMKACFRGWDDAARTAELGRVGQRGLRVVGLTAALAALGRE